MAGTRALRIATGAVGAAAMALGGVLLAGGVNKPLDVLVWLAGAVLLHDGVLVPAVLAVGALLPRRLRRRVRGGLICAACLTAVALPVVLRRAQGASANPTVLPLDYGRNLLVALAAVAALTAVWHGGRLLAHRIAPRRGPH